jgi:PST family polysaccharide transporter
MDAGWTKWLPSVLQKQIVGRPTLQALLTNSGWLLFDKVVRMVFGLTIGALVARYLGPEKFGQLNYAIAFVALFSAFATLGLDNIVVRDLVRKPEAVGKLLGSAFSLKLAGSLVALTMAETAILLLRSSEPTTWWLVGILAAGSVFQAFDVIDFRLQSTIQSKFAVLARIVAFVSIAFVRLGLIYTQAGLTAFAWAMFGELALAAAGLVFASRHVFKKMTPGFGDLTNMRRLLVESWPFMLSTLAIMLYMRIDQIMLASIAGEVQVGLYSAALRLSEIWYVIPMAIVSSVAPSLIATRSQSTPQYYLRIQKLFTMLTRIAYFIALPMSLLSTPLVATVFGANYAAAGPVLAVHIWTAVFVFLGVATGPWIVNEGLGQLQFYRTILGAITNVLLNLFLIPKFGGIGAAVATLVSQAVAVYLSFAFLKSTRNIFFMMTKAICFRG